MRKLYPIIIFCIFLCIGCGQKNNNIESYGSTPCFRKYPDTAYSEWKTICQYYPFIEGQEIRREIHTPLETVGFFCNGFLIPSPKEINLICEDLDKYKPDNK